MELQKGLPRHCGFSGRAGVRRFSGSRFRQRRGLPRGPCRWFRKSHQQGLFHRRGIWQKLPACRTGKYRRRQPPGLRDAVFSHWPVCAFRQRYCRWRRRLLLRLLRPKPSDVRSQVLTEPLLISDVRDGTLLQAVCGLL